MNARPLQQAPRQNLDRSLPQYWKTPNPNLKTNRKSIGPSKKTVLGTPKIALRLKHWQAFSCDNHWKF